MGQKTTPPRIRGLVVREFGKTNSVTCKDFDGNEQDLSSYTSIIVYSLSPDERQLVTTTGSFTVDGSTGGVDWSYASDNYLDRPGEWTIQIEVTKTGADSKSYPFIAEVERSLI
jgi:hypothetical protein